MQVLIEILVYIIVAMVLGSIIALSGGIAWGTIAMNN